MNGSTSKLRNVLSWNMIPMEYPLSVDISSTRSTTLPLISGKAFLRFLWECVPLLLAICRLSLEGDFGQGCVRLKHGRGPLKLWLIFR
jgi:hypothetical protein